MAHWFSPRSGPRARHLLLQPRLSHRQAAAIWRRVSVVQTERLDSGETCLWGSNWTFLAVSEDLCHTFPEWPPVTLCLCGIYVLCSTVVDSFKLSLRVLYSCCLILSIFGVVILWDEILGFEESIHFGIEGVNRWQSNKVYSGNLSFVFKIYPVLNLLLILKLHCSLYNGLHKFRASCPCSCSDRCDFTTSYKDLLTLGVTHGSWVTGLELGQPI